MASMGLRPSSSQRPYLSDDSFAKDTIRETLFSLKTTLQSRPDLLLLLSLLAAILLTPVLNQDNWRRLVLAAVTFIPVVISIIRLAQIKG